MKKLVLLLLLTAMTGGCVSAPQKLSSLPAPADYEKVGETSCKKCSFLLFGFIPIGFRDMVTAAYGCAVEGRRGHGLIEPTVRDMWFWTPVGAGFCTEVSGMAVRSGGAM